MHGIEKCKHISEKHISHIIMKDTSLCVRDKYGMSPFPMAVLHCKEPDPSILFKYRLMGYAQFYFSPMLKKTLRSRRQQKQLRILMEYAEVKHPSSWDNLFGKNKSLLNLQNAHGYSALHYACLFDLPNAVEKLIQAGIDITLVDNEGNQALHIASSHSDVTIVRTLLKHMGENCFGKNRNIMSALEIAVKQNRTDAVRVLILHMQRYMKHHPLCGSVNCYNKGTVQKIMNMVSFNNYFCREHNQPILVVALMNAPHTEETEDCKDNWDFFYSPFNLYFALREQSHKLVDNIFKHMRSISEEALCLWIKDLVEFKNYRNQYGNTLLHYSCWHNAIRMTKLLLELNADHIPNKDGNTPLHLSCIRGHVKVTRLLLEFKADLIPNKDGNTPLHLCCIHGHVKLTKVLLDKGLPVNIQNNASLCPLSCACTKLTLQIVELLLKYGFHPNSMAEDCKQSVDTIPSSKRRFLPINKAVNHLPEAVCLLLQYGASINFSSLGDDIDSVPHMILIKKIYFYNRYQPKYGKALCHLIKAGASFSKQNKFMQDIISIERNMCNQSHVELIGLLVESGYRFSIHLEIPEYLQQIQSNPYSLQCLVGHIIRTNLRPNAWVGVKDLGLPTELKKFVALNSPFALL